MIGLAPTLGNTVEVSEQAPEIIGISKWFNSSPQTIASLKGQVVLVDFWTYSCINCIRSLKHIESWYQKYHEQGFVVIGVHAPEFEFESDPNNVSRAIERFGIHYPVAMDNQLSTWRNYNNHYWPAHYLISRDGKVVETHFGEGQYAETEQKIQSLLGKAQEKIADKEEILADIDQTPETYLGAERAMNFSSLQAHEQRYDFPSTLALHHWALEGKWQIQESHIVSLEEKAQLQLHFYAGKVFLVLGTKGGEPIDVHVHFNLGEQENHDQIIHVTDHQLYELGHFDRARHGTLTLTATKPGLEAYAFTFGH